MKIKSDYKYQGFLILKKIDWKYFFAQKSLNEASLLMHKSFTLSSILVSLEISLNYVSFSLNFENRHIQTIAQVNLLIFSFISKKGSAFRFVTEIA